MRHGFAWRGDGTVCVLGTATEDETGDGLVSREVHVWPFTNVTHAAATGVFAYVCEEGRRHVVVHHSNVVLCLVRPDLIFHSFVGDAVAFLVRMDANSSASSDAADPEVKPVMLVYPLTAPAAMFMRTELQPGTGCHEVMLPYTVAFPEKGPLHLSSVCFARMPVTSTGGLDALWVCSRTHMVFVKHGKTVAALPFEVPRDLPPADCSSEQCVMEPIGMMVDAHLQCKVLLLVAHAGRVLICVQQFIYDSEDGLSRMQPFQHERSDLPLYASLEVGNLPSNAHEMTPAALLQYARTYVHCTSAGAHALVLFPLAGDDSAASVFMFVPNVRSHIMMGITTTFKIANLPLVSLSNVIAEQLHNGDDQPIHILRAAVTILSSTASGRQACGELTVIADGKDRVDSTLRVIPEGTPTRGFFIQDSCTRGVFTREPLYGRGLLQGVIEVAAQMEISNQALQEQLKNATKRADTASSLVKTMQQRSKLEAESSAHRFAELETQADALKQKFTQVRNIDKELQEQKTRCAKLAKDLEQQRKQTNEARHSFDKQQVALSDLQRRLHEESERAAVERERHISAETAIRKELAAVTVTLETETRRLKQELARQQAAAKRCLAERTHAQEKAKQCADELAKCKTEAKMAVAAVATQLGRAQNEIATALLAKLELLGKKCASVGQLALTVPKQQRPLQRVDDRSEMVNFMREELKRARSEIDVLRGEMKGFDALKAQHIGQRDVFCALRSSYEAQTREMQSLAERLDAAQSQLVYFQQFQQQQQQRAYVC